MSRACLIARNQLRRSDGVVIIFRKGELHVEQHKGVISGFPSPFSSSRYSRGGTRESSRNVAILFCRGKDDPEDAGEE